MNSGMDDYERVMRSVRAHGATDTAARRDGQRTVIPPFLYLPVRVSPAGVESFEVRPLPDGRRALLAYTALDRLLDACGDAQPWLVMQLEALSTVMEAQPFDLVSFDPVIADHLKSEGRLR